jgi:hypothetical protein
MNNINNRFRPRFSRQNGVYSGKIIFVSRDVYGNKIKNIFNIIIELKLVNLNTEIFDNYDLVLKNSVTVIKLTLSTLNGDVLEKYQVIGVNTNKRIRFNTKDGRQYAIKWVDIDLTQFLEVKVIGYDKVAVGLLKYEMNTNQNTEDINL